MATSGGWHLFHLAVSAEEPQARRIFDAFILSTETEMRRFAQWWLWKSGIARRHGDIVDVEDVLCEAYVELFQKRHRVQDPKPWLCTVTRRIALRYEREEPEKRASTDALALLADKNTEVRLPEEEELRLDRDAQALRTRRIIRKAVRKLPEQLRKTIIGLRYFRLTHKEMAKRLGVSTETIRRYHSRALHKLGGLLATAVD